MLPSGGLIDPAVGDIAKIFAAPANPADWPAWRADLALWRTEARARTHYRGTAYEKVESRWAAHAYSVAQVWLWDERLFDHVNQKFTVESFLKETADLGGFDGIVLWHAYPIIGIDNRNQYDFYRDIPGLKDVVAQLHQHNVRVFIDYNPWDKGTRRAAGDDADELAKMTAELGVDGVFLDTMKQGDSKLIETLLNAAAPQVIEGESRVPNQRIKDHQLSWAQWFSDSEAPGVMRAHWFERRHMMHSTRRWNRDHSDELQSAWMNGTGLLVWDAVFGVWVGWNNRDKATLRRMVRVQRALGELLVDGEWSPLLGASAQALAKGIYVSRYQRAGVTLWTVINRGSEAWTGNPLAEAIPVGTRRADVTAGRANAHEVTVPARGITGIVDLAQGVPTPAWYDQLMAAAAADSYSTDATFPARVAARVIPEASKVTGAPEGAVGIGPVSGELTVTFRRRETGFYQGAPYVERWKPLAPRLHDPRYEKVAVEIPGLVAVAAAEVTVSQFRAFLTETGYRPQVRDRFLVGTDAADPSNPVTGISLGDARAYATWAGARLPNEFEWQLAAEQAGFQRLSPAVWNWTESEHSDGITRFVMLKGGSDHATNGSDWYTDGGIQEPSFSLKFLLAGLGVERSQNIGFRLAWDLEGKR